ncbi:MAG: phosphate starvation-inducible protein PhoH, partial [Desulfotomaculaceae bacterium]|nr:phosphate starvation-inducible protein PhoH [Desulfotomaculaceae bacterium]
MESHEARVELDDIGAAAAIFGRNDEHLAHIEKSLGVRFVARGQELIITGEQGKVEQTVEVLSQLQKYYRAGNPLTAHEVSYALRAVQSGVKDSLESLAAEIVMITPRGKQIK